MSPESKIEGCSDRLKLAGAEAFENPDVDGVGCCNEGTESEGVSVCNEIFVDVGADVSVTKGEDGVSNGVGVWYRDSVPDGELTDGDCVTEDFGVIIAEKNESDDVTDGDCVPENFGVSIAGKYDDVTDND